VVTLGSVNVPGITQSFLILPGDTAAITLAGYVEGPDGVNRITVPVTVTARIA
jgi:hypothetical protein